MWRVEPTRYLELFVWFLVTVWSLELFTFGTSALPSVVADVFNYGPYPWLAFAGLVLSPIQLAAMLTNNRTGRARCSVVDSIWIGALAFSILFADLRIPTGLFYVAAMVLAAVPYWKHRLGRPI